MSAPTPENSNPSTKAKTAEVKTAIEAERISVEGNELDNEIKRYNDWGDATIEEIEKVMGKKEEWK